MKLFVQHGAYHCANCLDLVKFESDDRGRQMLSDATAIGFCRNSRCIACGVRFRVQLQQIEVERLE